MNLMARGFPPPPHHGPIPADGGGGTPPGLSSERILAVCAVSLILHALAAAIIPSAWWVPDVTLIGLIMTVAAAPAQWWVGSGCAMLLTLAWTIRHATLLCGGWWLIGWGCHHLVRYWDLTDGPLQPVGIGVISVGMTTARLWLEGAWSFPLLGLSVLHAAITALAAAALRPWFLRWVIAPRQKRGLSRWSLYA